MTAQDRVRLCRLIEEMGRHRDYCEKIGLSARSQQKEEKDDLYCEEGYQAHWE